MGSLAAQLDDVRQVQTNVAWAWWTEMGAPGAVRAEVTTALHPEALVVFTAPLAEHDARLREHAISWLLAHGRLLGARQVLAVANRLPAIPSVMGNFAATLTAAGGPAWAGSGVGTPIPGVYTPSARRLPIERSSLAVLRLRAAFGLHARAEVLAVLACEGARPITHAELAPHIASTPRNVRLALDDLVLAGVVDTQTHLGTRRYRCVDPSALREWVGPIPTMPAWPAILPALTAVTCALRSGTGDVERSVRGLRMLERHREALALIDYAPLPTSEGRSFAEELTAWLLGASALLPTVTQ